MCIKPNQQTFMLNIQNMQFEELLCDSFLDMSITDIIISTAYQSHLSFDIHPHPILIGKNIYQRLTEYKLWKLYELFLNYIELY